LLPISYGLAVPSAQVKSAILLAGLSTPGLTSVLCTAETRDHTERMLARFGACVATQNGADGQIAVSLTGMPELTGRSIAVPGDPSSAAVALVAALICPGSNLRVRNVGLNPLRIGLYETLRQMGADLTGGDAREEAGEPVGDLQARASQLRGV